MSWLKIGGVFWITGWERQHNHKDPYKWKKKSEDRTRVGSLGRTRLMLLDSRMRAEADRPRNEGGSRCWERQRSQFSLELPERNVSPADTLISAR